MQKLLFLNNHFYFSFFFIKTIYCILLVNKMHNDVGVQDSININYFYTNINRRFNGKVGYGCGT